LVVWEGFEAYCSEEDEGRNSLLCACHDGQVSGRLSILWLERKIFPREVVELFDLLSIIEGSSNGQLCGSLVAMAEIGACCVALSLCLCNFTSHIGLPQQKQSQPIFIQ
jgi:hypothetical protein